MEKGKVFDFIRRRGTLGILTLALVGIVAFASYRTSYPVTTETEMQNEGTQDNGEKVSLAANDQNAASANTQTADGQNDTAQIANTQNVQAQMTDYQNGVSQSADAQQADGQSKDGLGVNAAADGKVSQTSSGQVTADGTVTVKADHTGTTDSKADDQKTASSEETTEDTQEVLSGSVISPTVQFTEDSSLSWPAAGSILMDYSMDGTVYFQTLNEYKYNPALIISSEVGNPVVAAAKGIVESIDSNEETGTTLTMNIGDNYELIYGQLKELAVAEGDVVEQGALLGYVSEPTKYYCEEGSNLYFAMKKDGQITDPCLYLE